jgi:voltage-gated hydrogen channel 1
LEKKDSEVQPFPRSAEEVSKANLIQSPDTSYFSSWFHCFDALVIVASFVVDLLVHGIAEDIASLVVVLRLWRFVKIVEEVSVGAAERMEELEAQLEKVQEENRVMGRLLERERSRNREDRG